jgi:hypothetical protein
MLLDGFSYVEQIVSEICTTQKQLKDAYNTVNGHVRRSNYDKVRSIRTSCFCF